MGEVVLLQDISGSSLGKGIVNYKSTELENIRGKNTKEIKKLLGSKFFDEVINRDDMIIF